MPMSTFCVHREFEVPADDLTTIVTALAAFVGPLGDVVGPPLDYTATFEVFDRPGGGVLVHWTATCERPSGVPLEALRDSMFRDSLAELAGAPPAVVEAAS